MRGQRLNDHERRLWVLNDERLHGWWRSSRRGLYAWIRENRAELDACILRALNGKPVS